MVSAYFSYLQLEKNNVVAVVVKKLKDSGFLILVEIMKNPRLK